jgi:hypothetical protein
MPLRVDIRLRVRWGASLLSSFNVLLTLHQMPFQMQDVVFDRSWDMDLKLVRRQETMDAVDTLERGTAHTRGPNATRHRRNYTECEPSETDEEPNTCSTADLPAVRRDVRRRTCRYPDAPWARQ